MSWFQLDTRLLIIIYSEEAIADGRLSGVDVSALILSAHVLFKRKEFGEYSNVFVYWWRCIICVL